MVYRIVLVTLLALLGTIDSAGTAFARPCAVPQYDCVSSLDGRFGESEIDAPGAVPAIVTICKRDADIYRTCARHASGLERERLLMRLAYTDDVVAEAARRLKSERDATSYAHEARVLAERLAPSAHLSEDDRKTAQRIAAGEPLFPVPSAFAHFMSEISFPLIAGVVFFWPVLLAGVVVVALLASRRRAST